GILPDKEGQVSTVGQHMVAGSLSGLKAAKFRIVLGQGLAASLGVTKGRQVDLMIPQATLTPTGVLPRFRRFTVAGIFHVGMYQYDNGLVLLNLHDAKHLYRMCDAVTGLRLRLKNKYAAPLVKHQLASRLPARYAVTDWTEQHANFFRAIRTEKLVMFVILSLIVAVAAFNIVSTLVMVVTDKQSDIAILRTLGMTPRSIMTVFMIQGSLIGVIGTLVGVALGVLLSVNIDSIVPLIEKLLNTDLLSADVYYISKLVAELHQSDIVRIVVMSLGLSFLSTLYPAWRAARV